MSYANEANNSKKTSGRGFAGTVPQANHLDWQVYDVNIADQANTRTQPLTYIKCVPIVLATHIRTTRARQLANFCPAKSLTNSTNSIHIDDCYCMVGHYKPPEDQVWVCEECSPGKYKSGEGFNDTDGSSRLNCVDCPART